MYSTSSGRGFLPLVTAAHEISPSYSCKSNPVVGSGIYTSVAVCKLVQTGGLFSEFGGFVVRSSQGSRVC